MIMNYHTAAKSVLFCKHRFKSHLLQSENIMCILMGINLFWRVLANEKVQKQILERNR